MVEYTLKEEVFECCQNAVDNVGPEVFGGMTAEEIARDIAEKADVGVRDTWDREKGEYDEDEYEAAIKVMTGYVEEWLAAR